MAAHTVDAEVKKRKSTSRPDLLLLLSLVAVILLFPALDHGNLQKVILSVLIFVPVITATIRMLQLKKWIWRSALGLMVTAIVFAVAGVSSHRPVLDEIQWWILAAFFTLSVAALFSSFTTAPVITNAHLLTAVSIYLLIALLFFSLYSGIQVVHPGSIQHSGSRPIEHPNELLYFSLVTLATIGYGDIIPVAGEARMLAALEGVAGVLYIAITIALLVTSYAKHNTTS